MYFISFQPSRASESSVVYLIYYIGYETAAQFATESDVQVVTQSEIHNRRGNASGLPNTGIVLADSNRVEYVYNIQAISFRINSLELNTARIVFLRAI